MKKRLFLIRHAEAENNNFDVKDIERVLTQNGEIVASKVGKALTEVVGKPHLIMASNSIRTRQTAELIAEQLEYQADSIIYREELYEASARILLGEINRLPASSSDVLLIAHNPAIPYLAEYITGEIIGGVSPAGIVEVAYDGDWMEISEKSVQFIKYHVPPTA